MATKKKNTKRQEKITNNTKFSFIIPYNRDISLNYINKALSNLKDAYQTYAEFVIIHRKSDLQALQQEIDTNHHLYHIKSIPDEATWPEMLKQGIDSSQNERIIILDGSQLLFPLDLNVYFDISENALQNEQVIRLHYNNEKALDQTYNAAFQLIFPKKVAEYLFTDTFLKANDYSKEIRYKLKRLPVSYKHVTVNQSLPFNKSAVKVNPLKNLGYNIKLFFLWFFIIPLREQKTKPQNNYTFVKISPIYRLLFAGVAILLFVLMPIMSLNSSISGDEHVQYNQAENYYKFYASGGKDTSYMEKKPAYAYGMSFDLLTYAVNTWLDIENTFESRHILNALCGWLAILFSGLIAALLAGWRAGLLTMIFIFLTPRVLGHSFNNPKDIPFAMAYVFTLYYILKFLKNYPKFTTRNWIWIAVGIGMAISVRIGGLLLIAYAFLFAGFYYLVICRFKGLFAGHNLQTFYRIMLHILGISIVGYVLGILFWPYGLTDPIEHPLNSLNIMTHFSTSIRQLFEGQIYWSDHLPWYYITKYIVVTTPFLLIAGFIVYLALFRKKFQQYEYLWHLCLIFTFVFPLFWIIYQGSNVYGGWRHALFAFPTLAVACGVGYEKLLAKYKKQYVLWITFGVIFLLALKPLIHIIRYHPYEYVYYNELVGGVDGAYGDYEMDYYLHSLRPAAEWIRENVINSEEHTNPDKKIHMATNYVRALKYYLRDVEDRINFKYCRYYERGNYKWDYALFTNTYIDPYQQKNNIYPPAETSFHSIKINDAVLCAILKRDDQTSYKGYQELKNQNYRKAVTYLRQAKNETPHSEAIYVNLCKAYTNLGMYQQSIQTAYECLEFYPDYDQILNVLGSTYMRKGELKNALGTYNRLINVNPKFSSAYYYMGIIYMRRNQPRNALNYLQQCIQSNRGFKPAYKAAAKVLKSLGKNQQAQRYLQVAKSIGK